MIEKCKKVVADGDNLFYGVYKSKGSIFSTLQILITVSNCMPAIPRDSPVVSEL